GILHQSYPYVGHGRDDGPNSLGKDHQAHAGSESEPQGPRSFGLSDADGVYPCPNGLGDEGARVDAKGGNSSCRVVGKGEINLRQDEDDDEEHYGQRGVSDRFHVEGSDPFQCWDWAQPRQAYGKPKDQGEP